MKQSGIDPLTTRWVDATLRATAAPQLCYSTNIINVHQLREEVCRDTRRTQHILLLNSLTLWLLDSSPYPHNSACKNVQSSSRLISFFPLFVWCITRLEPLASSLCVYLGETSSLGTAQICNIFVYSELTVLQNPSDLNACKYYGCGQRRASKLHVMQSTASVSIVKSVVFSHVCV